METALVLESVGFDKQPASRFREASRRALSASAATPLQNSVVNGFVALFKELRCEGFSSHSGRRSFITVAARNLHRSGFSLRDVQLLAGHSSNETTERYIGGDAWAQRKLVGYV